MAHVIQALSNSIHKMDKLDKIDEIEARQKSSERMINDIVSDLRCELKHIKTPTANTPVVQTPSYTAITQMSQNTHTHTHTHTQREIFQNILMLVTRLQKIQVKNRIKIKKPMMTIKITLPICTISLL